jgi:hypothetical protein
MGDLAAAIRPIGTGAQCRLDAKQSASATLGARGVSTDVE